MSRSYSLLILAKPERTSCQLMPTVFCANVTASLRGENIVIKHVGVPFHQHCRKVSTYHGTADHSSLRLKVGTRTDPWASRFASGYPLLTLWHRLSTPIWYGDQRKFARSGNKTKLDARREKEEEEEEEEEDTSIDAGDGDDSDSPREWREVKLTVSSPRYDAILKTGLSCSRTKVEEAFIENRVRVNGMKTTKKSETAALGDEIDMIIGVNAKNPDFLDISRVIVDSVGDVKTKSKLTVNARVWRKMAATNYAGVNRYSIGAV